MRSSTAWRARVIRSSNFTGLVSNKVAWQSCRHFGRKGVCSILLIFSFYKTNGASASTPLFVSAYIASWHLFLDSERYPDDGIPLRHTTRNKVVGRFTHLGLSP